MSAGSSSENGSRASLVVLAVLITAIWGFNFVVLKVATDGVPPLLLAALRFAFLALPAVFVVERPRVRWTLVAAYGALLGVGQFGLLFTAIKLGAPPGLSSVILQTQAFFTALLAAAFLGERLRLLSGVGMVVASLGLALIAWHGYRPGAWGGHFVAALTMLIGAGFMWGAANVVARRIGRVGSLSLLVWASLVSFPPLFVLSCVFEGWAKIHAALAELSWLSAGAIAYLVLLSTVFGYGSWNALIVRYGASRVAPFSMLVPVFGVTSSTLLLGEHFTLWHAAAAALVLLGLALHVVASRS